MTMSLEHRYAFAYGAIFLGMGTFLPYFPVWLESRGLSAYEIGLLFSLSGVVRMGTMPVIAYVADRAGAPVRVLRLLTAVTLVANVAYLATGSFWPILAVLMVMTVFGPPIMPMTDALAMRDSEAGKLVYGRARAWGSVAFIVANVGVGAALGSLGPDLVVWAIVFAGALNVAAYFLLSDRHGVGEISGMGRVDIASALRLVRSPVFLIFALAAASVQATHAVYYAFGTLHWQSLGLSDTVIGALWAWAVVVEVALLWQAAPIVARIGPAMLIGLAAAGGIVRWTVMAFDPPLWSLPLLQCLHAMTFALAHLGIMQFLVRGVPPQLASTAQSVYSALASGIVMAGATFAAGRLYEDFGGLTYLAMTALAVLACGAAFVGHRIWNGERIDG
ncbi:MAG: MFS transporter [Candidatus Phaeomarinobacter sp.]